MYDRDVKLNLGKKKSLFLKSDAIMYKDNVSRKSGVLLGNLAPKIGFETFQTAIHSCFQIPDDASEKHQLDSIHVLMMNFSLFTLPHENFHCFQGHSQKWPKEGVLRVRKPSRHSDDCHLACKFVLN